MSETLRGGSALASDAIRVRRSTVADLETVVELRLALLREYHEHPIYGHLRDDIDTRARPVFEQQLKATDQVIFLADRDGGAVGIVRCADVRGSPLLVPERYCYVTSVYVRP